MPENGHETPSSEKNRPRTELWVLGAVAGVAVVCVSALAVAMALILGKGGALIQVNPVINGVPALSGGASPPALSQAPLQNPNPPADRTWPRPSQPLPLPGAPALPTAVPSATPTSLPRRADAVAPQLAPSQAASGQNAYQVRGEAADAYTGKCALPMPVDRNAAAAMAPSPALPGIGALNPAMPLPSKAASPVAPSAKDTPVATPPAGYPVRASSDAVGAAASPTSVPTSASGSVAASATPPAGYPVRASSDAVGAAASPTAIPTSFPSPQASPSPAALSANPTAEPNPPATPYSYLPASRAGASVGLQILSARVTKTLSGYQPSPGTRFFSVHVLVDNRSGDPLPLDGDSFDLRDSDGDSYMSLPAASVSSVLAPVLDGTQGDLRLAFLVPDDAPLASLSLVLPSETVLVPLARK